MATKATVKPRLVLYFQPWQAKHNDSSDSTHYRFTILHVDPKDEKPRNCSLDDWQAPGTAMFDDLELSAYISWHNGQFGVMWCVQYRGYIIIDKPSELETMLKGLKKAEKIRKDFPIQPQTLGQWVVLMCAGFGVKECCRQYRHGHTGMYTDDDWQYLPINYAQGWIDEEVDKLRKDKVGEPQAVTA